MSADTIVPSPGNVLDWDRYQYVRSNPLKFVDPTGHESFCTIALDGEQCARFDDGRAGRISKEKPNWKVYLLAAVVMSESNRATYPDNWMKIIAWTYLNRTTLVPGHSDLWQAVKGSNSAAQCFYQGCTIEGQYYEPVLEAPWLGRNATNDELSEYWTNLYKFAITGNLADEWQKAYDSAKSSFDGWTVIGTGSTADPTSHLVPGGATDFVMVKEEEFDSFGWLTWGPPVRPSFRSGYLGPAYISGLGEYRYMFISNKLLSTAMDLH